MQRTENKHFIFDNPKTINLKYYIKKILYVILSKIYKFLMFVICPRKNNNKKYKVSICAIFKNEALYLKEWIEYHKIVGVEHFYMYNNNSDDNFLCALQPYIDEGLVDLFEWPKQQAQMEAYYDCISKFSKETEWIGFIDIDEFVVPNKDDNIYNFLKKFRNRGAVIFYWQLFGASGKISRDLSGLVTEDFNICWEKYDTVGKCFYNTMFGFSKEDKRNCSWHHKMWTTYRGVSFPPVNIFDKIVFYDFHFARGSEFPAHINHYFTKSYKEYAMKKNKGDVFFIDNPHDDAYFFRHDRKCRKYDVKIYKYMVQLKLALKKE